MSKIIVLLGFIGSGKNATAEFLIKKYGYTSLSFADSLKDTCCAVFGWSRHMIEGDTDESRLWREQVDTFWSKKLEIPNFTPRMALQKIGTDLFRNHFNQDIWVHNVERKLDSLPKNTNLVIVDARYSNEIELGLQYHAKVIRVKRGDDPTWFNIAKSANQGNMVDYQRMTDYKIHESEWKWIGYPIHETLYNDYDLPYLHDQVQRIIL